MAKAVVIAAPASGSGKTMVTLGALRALRGKGLRAASAKAGPDYIDPAFHAHATGRPCVSLDLWAMGAQRCRSLLAQQAASADIVIVEGVMGLFDGPLGAAGSTADLAAELGLPVVLVVDCSHQAQSVAALVQGFSGFRQDVKIAGVVLNRIASEKHERILRDGMAAIAVPVLAALRRQPDLAWPSRHLGLVQAGEASGLEAFLRGAAAAVAASGLPDKLVALSGPVPFQDNTAGLLPPPGQRIAVARDEAFSFAYPAMLEEWRQQGAEVIPFSPLADEAADAQADAIILPGGYPELHAGRLAANGSFLQSLRSSRGVIYGECGGYMVLGEALVDAEGRSHAMAGLLPLVTSFKERRLQLGYRRLAPVGGPWRMPLRAHEFHYSTATHLGSAEPLFEASEIGGKALGPMGLRRGKVMGSYAHVIASEAA